MVIFWMTGVGSRSDGHLVISRLFYLRPTSPISHLLDLSGKFEVAIWGPSDGKLVLLEMFVVGLKPAP